jgi:hypothetical protein
VLGTFSFSFFPLVFVFRSEVCGDNNRTSSKVGCVNRLMSSYRPESTLNRAIDTLLPVLASVKKMLEA